MLAQPTFETIAVDDPLTPLTVGPFTAVHQMRFSAAIENWHRIHYDERFAREHDHLPGLLISGSYKQHLAAQMVCAWAGADGRLARIGMQFRAMNLVGETLTAWGVVRERRRDDDFGVVICEIGIRNEQGVQSSPGTATVRLPLGQRSAATAGLETR